MVSHTNMSGVIALQGLILPVETARAKFGAKYGELLGKLTIVHERAIGAPKKARIYKFVELGGHQCICLPRGMLPQLGKIFKFVNNLGPTVGAQISLGGELYDNQIVIIDHLCSTIFTADNIAAGRATCTLNLRAGMGKTFVAAGLIQRLQLRTLYIVPKKPLMVQTRADLRSILTRGVDQQVDPAPDPTLVMSQEDWRKKRTTAKLAEMPNLVTILVIDSALLKQRDFFAGFSLVIMDEIHTYCSEARQEIFWMCNRHAMFGMSATTEDRKDGFDKIHLRHFGQIIRAEEIPRFTYENVEFKCRAEVIKYAGPPSHTANLTHEKTGRVFTHYMHRQFIEDPYRLELATDRIVALYDWRGPGGQQHNIYVFAEELEILQCALLRVSERLKARHREDILRDIIAEGGDVQVENNNEQITPNFTNVTTAPATPNVTTLATLSIDNALNMFTGGQTAEQIGEKTANSRILFSTYGYAGTGISILKMTAIVFLTSRMANMKQILARILRRGSDPAIPRQIVDIVDKKTCIARQLRERLQAYDFYGFEVTETKCGYGDIKL